MDHCLNKETPLRLRRPDCLKHVPRPVLDLSRFINVYRCHLRCREPALLGIMIAYCTSSPINIGFRSARNRHFTLFSIVGDFHGSTYTSQSS